MKTDRRDFLKQMTVLTAAAAMPAMAATASAASKVSPHKVKPGKKVRLACIGIGNRGNEVFKKFEETGLCDFVAFCDIDMGAPQTLEVLEKYPDVPRYQDFRKIGLFLLSTMQYAEKRMNISAYWK